jgi:hypothetical protein
MSAAAALPIPPPPRQARIAGSSLIAIAVGVIVGVAVVATVVVLVRDPGEPGPTCLYPEPCGPPGGPPGLVSLSSWESPGGFSFRYDASSWEIQAAPSGSGALMKLFGRGDAVLRSQGSSGTAPTEALDAHIDALRQFAPDLTEDARNFRRVLGPAVGYRDGVGASYAGTTDSPQGPGETVLVSAMAATRGGVTVVVSVTLLGDSWQEQTESGWLGEDAFNLADSVINTVEWSA